MEQKQYDDMTSIMQFSRLFADAMFKAMDHCGLLGKNYSLEIRVDDIPIDGHPTVRESIHLRPTDNYLDDSRMVQFRFDEKGWSVVHDPVAKTGSIPPECCISKKESSVHTGTAQGGKPYPPDGLWIGSYDDRPYVGGGR